MRRMYFLLLQPEIRCATVAVGFVNNLDLSFHLLPSYFSVSGDYLGFASCFIVESKKWAIGYKQ